MKKSPVVVTLAIAGTIALSGCSSHSAPAQTSGQASVPTSSATSAAQVTSLTDAVAYALTITPQTPDALNQIDQTGKLLKQYADASTQLSAAQKSAADSFIAKSQQAVQTGDVTDAGANLVTAAQGVAQVLSSQ